MPGSTWHRWGMFAAACIAALVLPGATAAPRLVSPVVVPSPPAAAVQKRRYLVAAMGDSLTDPRSQGGKYLDVLRRACPGSRFDSYGVGGNMVNQMRKRFARDVLDGAHGGKRDRPRYSHVLVLGGINDICSDHSARRTNAKIRGDLDWMYRRARAAGLAVVALTLPPWGGFKRYYNPRRAASTLALNAWIRAQDQKNVDRVLDVYPLLSCGEPEVLCAKYALPDGVHWSKAGHEVVGGALRARVFADCQ